MKSKCAIATSIILNGERIIAAAVTDAKAASRPLSTIGTSIFNSDFSTTARKIRAADKEDERQAARLKLFTTLRGNFFFNAIDVFDPVRQINNAIAVVIDDMSLAPHFARIECHVDRDDDPDNFDERINAVENVEG